MFTNKNILLLIVLIAFGVVFRIFNNHYQLFNFNPTIAIALVAGMVIKDKHIALFSGLGIMLLTDLYFGFFTETQAYYGIGQVVNYLAVMSASLIGFLFNDANAKSVFGGTMLATLSFFVISNFGTWLDCVVSPNMHGYTADLKGLIDCYAMAIPFYKSDSATSLFLNSFISTLFFTPTIIIALQLTSGKLLKKAPILN